MNIKTIGKFIFFTSKIGAPYPMDPITATQNAIAAFFNFASTAAGQTMINQWLTLDAQIFAKIKDLFDAVHGKATAQATTPPKV